MMQKLLFAGSGGQGAILSGKLLALAAMYDGLTLTYFPSYGAEVRGGTSNCHVIVTDETEIFSPTVERSDILVVLNQPSYERFAPNLAEAGLLFIESDLVDASATKAGQVVAVPASATARKLGAVKAANVVLLGAVNARCGLVKTESLIRALGETMTGKKKVFLDINLRALEAGYALAGQTVSLTPGI